MKNSKRSLFWIAGIDLIIALIPFIAVTYLKQSVGFYSYAAIFLGIFTFFGIISMDFREGSEIQISSNTLRTAITSSVIIVYLYIVGLTTFFRSYSDELQPLTQTMISNFTTIVGVVIAFYFTSSAIIERGKKGPTEKMK